MTPEEQAAADAAALKQKTEKEAADAGTASDDFDKERAMATITTQRVSEAAAVKKAKELEAELATYREADNAKAEAEKALEVKVADRDQIILGKDNEIAGLHVQHSFMAGAAAKGIADPALAFLAAKEQGLLGEYDPKVGAVSDHNWDTLAEKYPSFAPAEQSQGSKTGDAGARGKGTTETPNDQFNTAFRAGLRR